MEAKEEPIPFFSDGNEDPFAQFKPAYKAAVSTTGSSSGALSAGDASVVRASSTSPHRTGTISPSKTPTPGMLSSMAMIPGSSPSTVAKSVVNPGKSTANPYATISNGPKQEAPGMVKLPTADSLFQDETLGDSGNNFFDAFAGSGIAATGQSENVALSNGGNKQTASQPPPEMDEFEEVAPAQPVTQSAAYSMDYSNYAQATTASLYSQDYSKYANSEPHADVDNEVPTYETQQPIQHVSNHYYFASADTGPAPSFNQTSNTSAVEYQAQQYGQSYDVSGNQVSSMTYHANSYTQSANQPYSHTAAQHEYVDQSTYNPATAYIPATEKSAPISQQPQQYDQPVDYSAFIQPTSQAQFIAGPPLTNNYGDVQSQQYSYHIQKESPVKIPSDRVSYVSPTSGGSKSSAHHSSSGRGMVDQAQNNIADYAQLQPSSTVVPSYTSPQQTTQNPQGTYNNTYSAPNVVPVQGYYQNSEYDQQTLTAVQQSTGVENAPFDPATTYSTVQPKANRRRRSLVVPANTSKTVEERSLGDSRSNSAVFKDAQNKPPPVIDNHPLAAAVNIRKNRMSPRPQSEAGGNNTLIYNGTNGNWNGLDPAYINRGGAGSTVDDDRSSVTSFRSNYNDCKQCLACSKYNELDANFCSKCGASLFSSSPAASNPIIMNAYNADSFAKRGSSGTDAASAISGYDPTRSYIQDLKSGGTPVHRQLDRVSNADEVKSNSSIDSFADPLGRVGCPLIAFGSGGKIVTMKPHVQKRYVNTNGQLTEVDKVMPGFLKISNSAKYFESYKFVKDAKFFDGPLARKKKKELIKLVQDLIDQDSNLNQPETSYCSLLRFMLLKLESDGKLLSNPDAYQKIVSSILKRNSRPVYISNMSTDRTSEQCDMSIIRTLLDEGKVDECIETFSRAGKYDFAIVLAQKFRKETVHKLIAEFARANVSEDDPLFSIMSLCSNNVLQVQYTVSNWREHVSMLLATKSVDDETKATIANLGFALCLEQDFYAGHLCCLIAGYVPDGANIALIGQSPSATLDHQSLLLTEVYESIMRLKASDLILPHLQLYKLEHACLLTDLGLMTESSKYCESIISSIKTYGKPSPYFDSKFLHRLTEFQKKLAHQGFSAKSTESAGWMQGLINKIDTTMSDIIGLDQKKLASPIAVSASITAAAVIKGPSSVPLYAPPQSQQSAGQAQQVVTSPPVQQDAYARYSYPSSFGTEQTIAAQQPYQEQSAQPGNTQAITQQSYTNYGQTPNYYDQQHTQYSYMQQSNVQQTGQSEYVAQQPPANQYSYTQPSASAPQQQIPAYGDYYGNNQVESNSNSMLDLHSSRYSQPAGTGNMQQTQQPAPKIGDVPTVPSYYMNSQSAPPSQPPSGPEAVDDLGFGNNSLAKQKQTPSNGDNQAQQSTAAASTADQKQQQDSSSGLYSFIRSIPFFRRNDSGNNKTANLGEQNSFVYDPVLKKWVNKAGGADDGKGDSTPLAPPPMGGNASLSRSNSALSAYGAAPPTTPTFPPISTDTSRTTSPMTDGGLRRASTTIRKKNPRNRYVDTLNPASADSSQPNNTLTQLTGAFIPPVQQFTSLSSYHAPQSHDRQSQ